MSGWSKIARSRTFVRYQPRLLPTTILVSCSIPCYNIVLKQSSGVFPNPATGAPRTPFRGEDFDKILNTTINSVKSAIQVSIGPFSGSIPPIPIPGLLTEEVRPRISTGNHLLLLLAPLPHRSRVCPASYRYRHAPVRIGALLIPGSLT